jgi:hypothetical protein
MRVKHSTSGQGGVGRRVLLGRLSAIDRASRLGGIEAPAHLFAAPPPVIHARFKQFQHSSVQLITAAILQSRDRSTGRSQLS